MKNIILITLLSCVVTTNTLSQNDLSKKCSLIEMQGIWHAYEYIKEPFPDVSTEFMIIKGRKRIKFDIKDKSFALSYIGFQNHQFINQISTKFTKDSLMNIGQYITIVDENNETIDIDRVFACEPNRIFLFYTSYERIDSLTKPIVYLLYRRGKKDHQNYLKEFLDKTFTEITTSKVSIYTAPSILSKIYLLKGDLVEVLETKDVWIKIRYYGNKTIEGWIKKSDVE